jgi:putative N6-adenine-specific DNA methylase
VSAPATHKYAAFAACAPGVEPLVLAELRSLGVSRISEEAGGVSFTCDAAGLARTQLSLRTASRVLVRLAQFPAASFVTLEKEARKVEWSRVIAAGGAARTRVTCRKSALYHSGAVAQRVEEAIARAVNGVVFERAKASEEEVDAEREAQAEGEAAQEPALLPAAALPAAQLIVVRLDHDRCTISADASGDLLHRRGYRLAVARAPLRETLAAAMLLGAGYDPRRPLADPMCGSGTIAIEGALIARRIAPGLQRRFAAESWPEVDATVWSAARETARARILAATAAPILGSDRDAGAIAAARSNAERAGVAADIEFTERALSAFEPPPGRGLLIMNPPYGLRLGEHDPLRDLFARLGQLARTRCPEWDVALLSADRGLERQTGLEFREVLHTKNGGIPVRLIHAAGHPAASGGQT